MKIDKKTLKSLNVEKMRRSKQAAINMLTDGNPKDVKDDLNWIKAYSQIIDIGKNQNRLRLSVIVALACLTIASLSWSVNIPSTFISFELQTSNVTILLNDNWSSRQPFYPESAFVNKVVNVEMPWFDDLNNKDSDTEEMTIEVKGNKFSVEDISLSSGAKVDLSSTGHNLIFRIKDSTVMGEILIEQAYIKIGKETNNFALKDDPPETLSFQTSESSAYPVNLGLIFNDQNLWTIRGIKLKEASFSIEYPIDTGNFESAILFGKVILPHTNKTVDLLRGDNLIIEDIKSRRFVLTKADNGILVTFEGSVSNIHAGPSGYEKNLMPTYLDFIYHQKRLVFFWSIVGFLWGLFWSVRNLLNFKNF